MKGRYRVALFSVVVCAFICAVFTLIQSNWVARARWELLTRGHFFYRLVLPKQVTTPPSHFPGGFTGIRLVYRQDRYMGYINNAGTFVPLGVSEFDNTPSRMFITVALPPLLQCLSGVISVAFATVLIVDWTKRRLASGGHIVSKGGQSIQQHPHD